MPRTVAPQVPDLPTPETPEERYRRITEAVYRAQTVKGEIDQGITAHRDNEIMRKAHRFARESDLGLDDLAFGIDNQLAARARAIREQNPRQPVPERQFLTEEFPTDHDDVVMEEMYQQPPRQVRQQQYAPQPSRRMLTEQQPPLSASDIYRSDGSGRKVTEQPRRRPLSEEIITPRRQPEIGENWKVKRYLGETRNGQEVHVWKVENTRSGTSLRNMFRMEGVAQRIALILNESGDTNDPRAVSLVNAYEKRNTLLKEARALEKSSEGKVMKTERLRAIRGEINQLDFKLGV